jgi:hypothetical protein
VPRYVRGTANPLSQILHFLTQSHPMSFHPFPILPISPHTAPRCRLGHRTVGSTSPSDAPPTLLYAVNLLIDTVSCLNTHHSPCSQDIPPTSFSPSTHISIHSPSLIPLSALILSATLSSSSSGPFVAGNHGRTYKSHLPAITTR